MTDAIAESRERKSRAPISAILIALVLGGIGGCSLSNWNRERSHATVSLAGADVSRHGGQLVELSAGDLTLKQTCAQTCDDVVVNFGVRGEGEYKLKVAKANGECALCEEPYIDDHTRDRVQSAPDGSRLSLVR